MYFDSGSYVQDELGFFFLLRQLRSWAQGQNSSVLTPGNDLSVTYKGAFQSVGWLQFAMVDYFSLFLVVLGISPAYGAFVYSFPDCANGPLKNNTVCDTTKDPVTRARAVISLFTVQELIANTVNTSPGVPRLGLPGYQWWSEALVGLITFVAYTWSDQYP